MTDSNKVDRRRFLADGSAAVVGAAALTGTADAVQQARPAATPEASKTSFTTASGASIPYGRDELLASGPPRTFADRRLNEIAFPLGGIGTGTVSLGGRGDLRDWEIFNRPNKGKALPFTFVALWARQEGQAPVLRVAEGPLQPPFRGAFGYPRDRAQGLPHMQSARFGGAYPIAEVALDDPAVPLAVTLEAFNPFVPLDTEASSLPVAIFRYRLRNPSTRPVQASVAFSILNPIGYDGRATLGSNRYQGFGQNVTRVRREASMAGLEMTSQKYEPDDPRFGSMALVTTTPDLSARASWEPGAWFDSFQRWFDEFSSRGGMEDIPEAGPTDEGVSNFATMAPRVTLGPGDTQEVTFVLAWYFPVRINDWNSEPEVRGRHLRNDYGTRFTDAWDVARYTVEHLPRLERDTRAFREGLTSSTLPSALVDAVSSQMSIIRTNTCLLLEGRRFFAFEGTGDDSGCCPMNCTHVWNYEQALAHLFPDLERSMRVTDFTVNLHPDGAMAFRTLVPTGRARWKFKPAADGQMGCILKLYREWQISGDLEFLRGLWPAAKRALEYAWVAWDEDRDGVMEGEQHNTYDIEFYGPNTMMGTLYLGALLAGERMARALGDSSSADEYRRVFDSGRKTLDAELWSDGYYVQRVPDVSQIKVQKVENKEAWYSEAVEKGAVKYQYGQGCLSDQLLGQWFSEVVGLGHLLPVDHVRGTLASIFRYNFRHDFGAHPNVQRIYALNDEKGLVLCSWPRGQRPGLPFVYSDEVWTGIEYQVAAHLIYEGMVEEGLAITKAVRDRYDGERRNPWNEVECGSHYARALASWSLLTGISGYRWSAPESRLSFAPRINQRDFRCFFTASQGWGVFAQKVGARDVTGSIELGGGRLELARFGFAPAEVARGEISATVAGRPVTVKRDGADLFAFEPPARLAAGERLTITLRR
jgi:non-lysosomal glucosylceramidase